MKLPDGPKTARWLQLVQWILDPLGYMEACKEKYGDIFKLGWSQRPRVMVSHPQAMQEILTSDRLTAPGYPNEIFRPLIKKVNSCFKILSLRFLFPSPDHI